VINRLFFPAIKLVKEAVFLNKGNKVCIDLVLYFSLTFFDRFLMLLAKIFVGLEPLSDFLWLFAKGLLSEFVKIAIFLNKVVVFVHFIHDDVKKGNCSASIFGVLPHEE
jgi:hypothetical protein